MGQQLFEIHLQVSNIRELDDWVKNGSVALSVPRAGPADGTSVPVEFISNRQCPSEVLPGELSLEVIPLAQKTRIKCSIQLLRKVCLGGNKDYQANSKQL